jgi:hypothetical protein
MVVNDLKKLSDALDESTKATDAYWESQRNMKSKEGQIKELDKLIKAAYDALKKARVHASKYGLRFDWTPAKGFGGDYFGKGNESYNEKDYYRFYQEDEYGGHWCSSSQGC